VEQVHEEGFQDVVAVMAQHHGRTALFARDPVKVAAPQPRTERTHRAARLDLVGDDRIGVLIFDPVRTPIRVRNSGSTVAGKPGWP
jgi:hypothetical protein